MNSVRMWYEKSGLAVYTSHLDMNRCFTRAVRRADIPLWYTEGFNPHPYMTFLLPLPLGQAGVREPVDIRTESEISNEEILSRMNSVLPEGLRIVDVTEPVDKVNTIKYARYEMNLEFASAGEAQGFAAGALSVIEQGKLMAEKRSKRGAVTVNLCDFIHSFEAKDEGSRVIIETVLLTGTEKNLNAGLLTESLLGEFGAETEKTSIKRDGIYKDNLIIFK